MATGSLGWMAEVAVWALATVLGLLVAAAVYLIAWAASYAKVPSDRP